MNYYICAHFKKQLKKFKKKYKSVVNDLITRLDLFEMDKGVHIHKSIYKLRVLNSDTKSGKSGGYRCYVYLYKVKNLIVPLCIYTKSSRDNLTDNELKFHFDKCIEELI